MFALCIWAGGSTQTPWVSSLIHFYPALRAASHRVLANYLWHAVGNPICEALSIFCARLVSPLGSWEDVCLWIRRSEHAVKMCSCDPLIYFKPGPLLLSLKRHFPNALQCQASLQSALTESPWRLRRKGKAKDRLNPAALCSGPENMSGGSTVFPAEMGVDAECLKTVAWGGGRGHVFLVHCWVDKGDHVRKIKCE